MTELRLLVPLALMLGAGVALLLSELRSFRRVPLGERLTPYGSAGVIRLQAPRRNSSTRDLAAACVAATGERLSALLGVHTSLALRLQRAHSTQTVEDFRFRQFGIALGGLGVGLIVAVAVRPPLPLVLLFVIGLPVLGLLITEQRATTAAQKRQRQIFDELPLFSEQLAMLLGAGFSIGSALNRLSQRAAGVINHDLAEVCERMRHGLTAAHALREWSDTMAVPELDRLVAVLALGSESSDLGRLVSEEARGIRREAQRRLAATIDKRAQQVWIPVTVATLVPGVIFLAIPFFQALSLFSGS